jgi:hypothetical protein
LISIKHLYTDEQRVFANNALDVGNKYHSSYHQLEYELV